MKYWSLLLVLVFISACSSTPKKEPAPVQPEVTPAPAPEAPPPPEPATTEDKMVMDTGGTTTGGFPDVEGTERSGATCTNGGDERMVSVIDTKEGPCGVVYSKYGKKLTVAYAKFEMPFCDKVYENILGNLKNGGFDCGGAGSASSAEESSGKPADSQ